MSEQFSQPPNERDLLLAALDLPPNERSLYLKKACLGSADLEARIKKLLKNVEQGGSFMEAPAIDLNATTAMDATDVGKLIGRYRLMEQIGEGGMGVVFVAEQTEPIARKVALKIIKPGMDTKSVIARFEAERQALALMDHPNIARVLDAGTTPDRLPYFVMELVRGLPITEYCDQARANLTVRLNLFVDVCRAVQHAHQKGIIHRDLKPSNILVTLHDGKPVVKVIDFGLAKALHQQLTANAVYTAFNQILGTPLYMSPEQMELSGLDIDTRSDVYSLGVLLYELLCGTTPFDRERLLKSGWDEICRIVREEDPPRPSDRVFTLSEKESSTIAANRGLESRELVKTIRSELDWIVNKTLEKDRNRRYSSAADLGEDISRYLRQEAVHACPPSWTYRSRKILRQYRVAVSIFSAAVFTLLLGLIATTWQWRRAVSAEKRQSELVRLADEREQIANARLTLAENAIDVMYTEFSAVWLNGQTGQSQRQKEFLDKAIASYKLLAEQSPVESAPRPKAILARIRAGQLMKKTGKYDEALIDFTQAYELALRGTQTHPEIADYQLLLAKSQIERADVFENQGDTAQKLSCADAAAKVLPALSEKVNLTREQKLELRGLLQNCALHFSVESTRKDQARLAADAALKMARDEVARNPEDQQAIVMLAHSLSAKGQTLLWWGFQNEECEKVYRECVGLEKQIIAKDPRDKEMSGSLIRTMKNLGIVLGRLKRQEEADALKREYAILLRTMARKFPDDLRFQADLGELLLTDANELWKAGKYSEAQIAQDESIRVLEQLIRDYPEYQLGRWIYMRSVRQAGGNATKDGRLEVARQLFQDANQYALTVLQMFPDDMKFREQYSLMQWQLAVLKLELGDYQAALQSLRVTFESTKRERERSRQNGTHDLSFQLPISVITASCESLTNVAVKIATDKLATPTDFETFVAEATAFQMECRDFRDASFAAWRAANPDYAKDWRYINAIVSSSDAWQIASRLPELKNFREDAVAAAHGIMLRELFTAIRELKPVPEYWADVLLAITSCTLFFGDDQELLQHFESSVNPLPNSPNAMRAHAWLLFRCQDYEKAIQILDEFKTAPEDLFVRSMVLTILGRSADARKDFEQARVEVQMALESYTAREKATQEPFQPNSQTLLRLQAQATRFVEADSSRMNREQ